MATGAGIFFDGHTSERRQVTVEASPDALRVRDPGGALMAEWPYGEVEAMAAPENVLRLGRIGSPVLARIEIRDPALASIIDEHAVGVDRSGLTERRTRRRVVLWSIAATISLVLVALFGLPALVERLTPLIPMSVEHKFGVAVDAQVRSMLDTTGGNKPFECGTAESEKEGRAALDKMLARIHSASGLPIPLKTAVVRRTEPNAIALPGGHVYVFQGLISRSQTPDELAGVIAHEVGHVAHRDGTRSVLQSAGYSFLFGMLLGDFTGGGVVVIAARKILQSAYSRDAESGADRYAVDLMTKLAADGRALGTILARIGGSADPGIRILLDHPETKERVATINAWAASAPARREPLLAPAEWAALRRICG